MGEGPIVVLAVVGGIVAAACAAACAVACAWLARAARTSPHVHPTQPRQVHYAQPAPTRPATLVVAPPPAQQFVPLQHPTHPDLVGGSGQPAHHRRRRSPITLEGHYPQLGAALGAWLQVEPDEVERARIAHDLGTVGGADSARALLDGVRTGVISPTVAADHLERGGFDAGVTVAAALGDPEPRVRALASALAGRSIPLQPVRLAPPAMPPMPEPPTTSGP